MFEKIAKHISRILGIAEIENMTEAEVLNQLEDMAPVSAAPDTGAIEVLTASMAEFETRLSAITELTDMVQSLTAGLDTANGTIAQLTAQLSESRDEVAMINERVTATTAQANTDIQTLAADITAIKGTTTAVQSTDNPAPVPIGAGQNGQIKNDIIAQRLAGVKIGTFANRRNFQHN